MKLVSSDLILKNARIITCDPAKPVAEALAVRGERILLTGTNDEAEQVRSPGTRVIDCRGKTLVPGFIDAHCHIFSLVRRFFSLDLSPASVRSIADIREAVRRQAQSTPEGGWISGAGYNDFYLAEKRHPDRRDLDEAAPRHPVIISHRSHHACVLNSLALRRIGIGNESEAPPGGLIERDLETGEPNGILFEMQEYVQERIRSPLSPSEMDRGVGEAGRQYLSLGITSLGDASAGNDLQRWHLFRKLKEEGKLKSRIYMMPGMRFMKEFREAGLVTGSGDDNLRLGGLKIVLSEAAGCLEPAQDELNRMVIDADRAGFQVAIHAVERSTVEAAITALENAERVSPHLHPLPFGERQRRKRRPLRQREVAHDSLSPVAKASDRNSGWEKRSRIEHCSECPPDLRRRLGKLKAVIVSQPPFIYYSGERYLSRVSREARQWLYPFKSLMDSGLTVAGSSDSPIVPNDPLVGIFTAATRLAESGQKVLASESVTARQALEMYTRNAAYAAFEEDIKGSLSPGKLADIVILSADPLQSPPERIKEIVVEMTVSGGEIVYRR